MKLNTKVALLVGGGATLFLTLVMGMIFVYNVNKKETKYSGGLNLFSNQGKGLTGLNKVMEERK